MVAFGLGWPPKDPEINAVRKQLLSADQRTRNEVEGALGQGAEVCTQADHGAAGQGCSNLYLHGISGDVS